MRADERFLNPAGIVQGGFLAAMLDSAMGASAVTALGERRVSVANTEMKVSFLRAVAAGDVLTCVATVLKPGPRHLLRRGDGSTNDARATRRDGEFYLPDKRPF